MGGRTSAASKYKYNVKTYDRVNLSLKKADSPTKAETQAAADTAGESLNMYITKAIAARLESEKMQK